MADAFRRLRRDGGFLPIPTPAPSGSHLVEASEGRGQAGRASALSHPRRAPPGVSPIWHSGPDGEILVDGVHNALCDTCRALMSRGIVASFETRKPGIDYPSVTGDIEKTAGLTVNEPDDGVVHFARWRPLDQSAVSRSAVLAPAREDDRASRRVAADTVAYSSAGIGQCRS